MDAADDLPLPEDLAFVDLETTGGNAAHHRITEIGIVRVANGELLEEWSTLVNPECRIPPYIEAFTGISNEMVADAPRFGEIATLVRQKLDGAVFVAHNARFDYAFLRNAFRRADRRFSARVLCTVKLSRRLFPDQPRHNLDAVMERHHLTCAARHRALGDARVLWDLWRKFRGELPEARLRGAVHALLRAPPLPAQLPQDLADELPEGPGVYRFFGEDDALLYVGKSISLRTRVLTHFAGSQTDAKEQRLARQVRRVDWLETAGELGAQLREAEWIKTQKPLHNRRLRGPGDAVTLRLPPGSADRIEIAPAAALGASALAQCYGLFRSSKDAQKALVDIARARQLCLKALGVEDGEGSCFAYQVGKCRGVCAGKENPVVHAMRVRIALAAMKLKTWPLPGRVAVRERDGCGSVELHVCEDWAYLGTARSDEELADFAAAPPPIGFDADVYRILARYFAATPNLDWLAMRTATSSA